MDKVFIIDDDPIIVYSIKRVMKEMGFFQEFLAFENGKLALEDLIEIKNKNQKPPDVIFLDLAMPVMNGWTFLEEFEKYHMNTLGIRIIVISSSVNPSEITKINSYSYVEKYIVKPITPSDLRQLIDI